MYNVTEYTCTMSRNTHVQCHGIHMYNVTEYTCTMSWNTHVQCHGIHITMSRNMHVQCHGIYMYNVTEYTCILSRNTHVQCHGIHIYNVTKYKILNTILVKPGGTLYEVLHLKRIYSGFRREVADN
jgi:hypothetical protein